MNIVFASNWTKASLISESGTVARLNSFFSFFLTWRMSLNEAVKAVEYGSLYALDSFGWTVAACPISGPRSCSVSCCGGKPGITAPVLLIYGLSPTQQRSHCNTSRMRSKSYQHSNTLACRALFCFFWQTLPWGHHWAHVTNKKKRTPKVEAKAFGRVHPSTKW